MKQTAIYGGKGIIFNVGPGLDRPQGHKQPFGRGWVRWIFDGVHYWTYHYYMRLAAGDGK